MTDDALRLSFDIACPSEHAFEVWTRRLSSWWPKGHSASGHPDTVVTLEPRLGGDWGELTFVDLGDGTTRLEIVHSGWERLGAAGASWRDANTAGWEAMLPGFVAAAEA